MTYTTSLRRRMQQLTGHGVESTTFHPAYLGGGSHFGRLVLVKSRKDLIDAHSAMAEDAEGIDARGNLEERRHDVRREIIWGKKFRSINRTAFTALTEVSYSTEDAIITNHSFWPVRRSITTVRRFEEHQRI